MLYRCAVLARKRSLRRKQFVLVQTLIAALHTGVPRPLDVGPAGPVREARVVLTPDHLVTEACQTVAGHKETKKKENDCLIDLKLVHFVLVFSPACGTQSFQ